MPAKVCKCFTKILYVIFPLPASNDHIVHICGDVSVQLIPEHLLDHPVKCTARVAKAFWHPDVIVCPEGSGEVGFLFVSLIRENLVIAGEAIQHAQHF